MSLGRYINSVVSSLFLAVVMYYAHRMLQLHHYRYCRRDLIRIIFYDQSLMCTHITRILKIVEEAGNHVVKHLMSHVICLLERPGDIRLRLMDEWFFGAGMRTILDVGSGLLFPRTSAAD